jgi:hypothetical protein
MKKGRVIRGPLSTTDNVAQFSTVSSTALAVAFTSLPTPRTVLAHAASATALMTSTTGASLDSFMDGYSLVR